MKVVELKEKIKKFPKAPGVYIFRSANKKILYIGKATSLRSRVGSYFSKSDGRANVDAMMGQVSNVEIRKTDIVLEALILEANLIKKYQPKYNIDGKDDRSFSYFLLTKEDFPRVLIFRKTDFDNSKYGSDVYQKGKTYGPYTSKQQMQIALKIIRKIFPFHSRNEKSEKECLDFQLGTCPGPYDGQISKAGYKKNIRGVKMVLEGKRKSLLKSLNKEMKELSKKEQFEKAAEVRNKIFALNHIQDIALISRNEQQVTRSKGQYMRIEAYDISNISGEHAVGSMVVFEEDRENKSEYRRFKIKTVHRANDVGMMKEILERRFKNNWKLPDLIILDGGKGHVNMAEKILKKNNFQGSLIGVAKGPTRRIDNYNIIFSKEFSIQSSRFSKELKLYLKSKNFVKKITDEAHRFAITYHRKLRKDKFIRP